MPISPPSIFLDSSVLLAAIFSETGGSREILRLGEAKLIELLVSSDVVGEIDDVLRLKLPSARATMALLLDSSNIQVTPPPAIATVQECQRWVQYAKDAVVLAGAVDAKAHFFVTLDRKHFLNNQALRTALPFPLGTPGDFLTWTRQLSLLE